MTFNVKKTYYKSDQEIILYIFRILVSQLNQNKIYRTNFKSVYIHGFFSLHKKIKLFGLVKNIIIQICRNLLFIMVELKHKKIICDGDRDMEKYIILDFGKVLAYPPTGYWQITPKFLKLFENIKMIS